MRDRVDYTRWIVLWVRAALREDLALWGERETLFQRRDGGFSMFFLRREKAEKEEGQGKATRRKDDASSARREHVG